MKQNVLIAIVILTSFWFPKADYGQSPNLGTAADFVLFTTVGAITNTGI